LSVFSILSLPEVALLGSRASFVAWTAAMLLYARGSGRANRSGGVVKERRPRLGI
jgi:hypothetical protein